MSYLRIISRKHWKIRKNKIYNY